MGSVFLFLSVQLMAWKLQWTRGRFSSPQPLDSPWNTTATTEEVKGGSACFFWNLTLSNYVSNFSLSILLEIILPSSYRNYVRGLCGNYDGITRNEYMKPDGTVVRDLNAFGDSWRITDRQTGGLRSIQVPHTVHRWDLSNRSTNAQMFYICIDLLSEIFNKNLCSCLQTRVGDWPRFWIWDVRLFPISAR